MTKYGDLTLTVREQEAYSLMVNTPDSLSRIATELGITRPTMATFAEKIYQKKEVNGRLELIIKHYKDLIRKQYNGEDE